jgi:hypothetical protein
MFLYALVRFMKPRRCYNHAEVRYGELTSGAIAQGIATRPWPYYVASKKRIEWIDYQLQLTDQEWQKGYAYLQLVEGRKYEYSIFWNHAVKIFTGRWKGRTTDKKLYCYEHVIRFLIATGKYNLHIFKSPYRFRMWADQNL